MGMLSLEHGKAAYRADFVLYACAVVGLATFLAVSIPGPMQAQSLALAVFGFIAWTGIEYSLHRFVLHGIEPFKSWHARHHHRPAARICMPTIFSASLIFVLAFVPAFALLGRWGACGFTLGVTTGYLAYGTTHHAVHNWRARGTWLTKRKQWHALHHGGRGGYGVTTDFWDRLFAKMALGRTTNQ